MQVYLGPVRSLHVLNGMEPPPICSPHIKLALKAAYKLDTPSKPKAPITPHIGTYG